MTDQQPKEDNLGTGAEISTENDTPAHFYDLPDEEESRATSGTGAASTADNVVPTTSYDGPDGATQNASAVALASPYAAPDRRSSTLFPLRDANSLHDAADAASTVAGAAAGATIEQELYQDALVQSREENARLARTAQAAEQERHAGSVTAL